MHPFCIGLPRSVKICSTRWSYAQAFIILLVNSELLSVNISFGRLRNNPIRFRTADTLRPVMGLPTSNARHSRVTSSMTVRIRMIELHLVLSLTKSIDQRALISVIVHSGIPRFSYFFFLLRFWSVSPAFLYSR